jgi:Spy/CpxP family protein refolding chaperone
MNAFAAYSRRISSILAITLVLSLVPIRGAAGEFKVSRYIEPNQVSNLFTRHVRKGIIKRIGLTDTQLREIRATIDPLRETLLAQITELKDARIELIEAVAAQSFDQERVQAAHAAAMSKELDLILTAGIVIGEVRPILTEEQLDEVTEMMEEIRESSEIRFADFAEKMAAGQLLGLKDKNRAQGN